MAGSWSYIELNLGLDVQAILDSGIISPIINTRNIEPCWRYLLSY